MCAEDSEGRDESHIELMTKVFVGQYYCMQQINDQCEYTLTVQCTLNQKRGIPDMTPRQGGPN